MHLASDWKLILKKAWSIRLLVIAGLLSGVEVAMPLLPWDIPPAIFASLSGLFTMAAFIARIVAQKDLPDAD